MDMQQLIEKRAKAWEAAKSFLDSHRTEKGVLSAEDSEAYDRMEKDITDLTKEIERLTRQQQIEDQLNQPVSTPLTAKPGATNEEPKKTGRASNEYRQAMITAMRTHFRQVSDYLNEDNDNEGGYLVPEEWDSRLIDVLTEENIMRGLGTKITTSGEHKINIAGNKPAASWIEEGGALSFGDATFDQIVLDAHKLHVAIKVTEELLYDNAFNLENYIITQFGKAIANAEEDAFLNGDGNGKPTGLFHATKGGQVGVTTAKSNAIAADEVLDLIYSLKRPYRKKASFIANDSTLATLRKLKDGNGAYMWQPALVAGEPDRLMGYGIHTSTYAPELAAGNVVLSFGDYSYYNIGDRGTRSFQELRELFAGNGMIGYVAKERVDGILVLPEAVKLMKAKAE